MTRSVPYFVARLHGRTESPAKPGFSDCVFAAAADAPAAVLNLRAVPKFELQFPGGEIESLAARFGSGGYDGDARLRGMGDAVRARGYYTRGEFITVCAWKSPRSRPKILSNSRALVVRNTRAALTAPDEPGRIEPLLALSGVGVPTASTLLFVAFPAEYPILDVRALESLGAKARSTYPLPFWLGYLDTCRRLAREHGVTIRTLDKALWQHSKEQAEVRRDAAAGRITAR